MLTSIPSAGASSMPEMEMKQDPMAQAYRRTTTGLVASSAKQGGRVDDRVHGHAEPGPLEEEIEADGGADGQGEHDDLAAQDRDAEEVDALAGQEGGELDGGDAVDAGQAPTRAARPARWWRRPSWRRMHRSARTRCAPTGASRRGRRGSPRRARRPATGGRRCPAGSRRRTPMPPPGRRWRS